jgi:hypothetical protein
MCQATCICDYHLYTSKLKRLFDKASLILMHLDMSRIFPRLLTIFWPHFWIRCYMPFYAKEIKRRFILVVGEINVYPGVHWVTGQLGWGTLPLSVRVKRWIDLVKTFVLDHFPSNRIIRLYPVRIFASNGSGVTENTLKHSWLDHSLSNRALGMRYSYSQFSRQTAMG